MDQENPHSLAVPVRPDSRCKGKFQEILHGDMVTAICDDDDNDDDDNDGDKATTAWSSVPWAESRLPHNQTQS